MTLLEQVVAAFVGAQVNAQGVPESDPRAKIAKLCESLFTGGVDVLRSVIPNDRVRALGRLVWDLVGNKRALVAIGPDVPSLAFTFMRLKGVNQVIVLIPKTWPEMVAEDPFMQLGAILFVGSQVVDFYNDRLIGDPGAAGRRQAYEAELLLTLKAALPCWEPNEYQREILARWPNGLDTAGVDVYPLRPYEPPKGDA